MLLCVDNYLFDLKSCFENMVDIGFGVFVFESCVFVFLVKFFCDIMMDWEVLIVDYISKNKFRIRKKMR